MVTNNVGVLFYFILMSFWRETHQLML